MRFRVIRGSIPARPLVIHRPRHIADLEQADLAEHHAREGVGDKRVDPRLVDLDVEDTAAARSDYLALDFLLPRICEFGVHPGAVEQRPDDVELGFQARPRIDDPEAYR